MTDREALAAVALKTKLAIVAAGAIAIGGAIACKIATAPGKTEEAPTAEVAEKAPAAELEGETPVAEKTDALPETIRYGFRHDPMKFVEEVDGLQTALVRKHVFGRPKPGDEDTIEAHFREVFAKQNADGSLDDPHGQGVLAATGETLVGLLRMGCAPDRAEMKLALEAVEKALAELPVDKAPSACYALHALSAAGRPMDARAKLLIKRLAKDTVDKLGTGCPGTPFVQASSLWACRERAGLDDDVEAILRWVEGAVEPPGCSSALGLCHPNGIVEMVGQMEHPTARRIALKIVAMLLRSQEADGGWGDATFHAFAALKRHGLLDRLRTLPPLPPDWKVVRSIPAPVSHRFSVLAFDDGMIWINDPKSATAVAVSPEDGSVVRTVELPKRPGCVAFGAWGGSLWVLPGQPKETDKTIYQVNSRTGDVVKEIPIPFEVRHFAGLVRSEGRALICDQWEGCVWAFDPDAPEEHKELRLAAGMPDFAASVGREIWALDSWAPAVVKTNLRGELLDWGERPFGWAAIAWDGEHLWALDNKNKRICMIEKNVPDAERAAKAGRAKELLRGQKYGFRVDPMKFVEEGEGLQASLVRKQVFKRPKPGDDEVVQAEIDKVLAQRRGDGALGKNPNDTADKLLKLLSLGCPPDRPEVALALDSIEKAAGGPDADTRLVLEALLAAGRSDRPYVRESLGRMAKETVAELGEGCPGTPYAQLRILWLGKNAADVDEEIESILKWLEDAVEPPGCSRTLGLCYIWGIFETLGEIDRPVAARVTAKLVPMIVRCQGDDGGWKDCYGKDKSLWFFRALSLHGLLEPLRELPPLPPDWRIARSIPAPGEKPRNIGFAHGHLWVLGDGALTAISEDDGGVIKSVKLERRPGRSHFALAEGDGSFWLSAFADKKKNRPAAVVEFDAETGEVLRNIPLTVTNDPMGIAKVGSKLLVGDGWAGGAWLVDIEKPDAKPLAHRVAASMPDYMSNHGDDIWCVDWFSPSLVRTNLAGDLVDWGERPFGFEPVAFDGKSLCVLDSKNKRICMIEKNVPGAERDAAATRAKELLKGQKYGFRVDPMKFVEEGEGLQAALVRKQVFGRPKPGDDEVVQAEIDKMLAEQREDGSFADTSKQTGSRLLALLRLGLPMDRPEVARAADAILRQHRAGQNANEWYEKDRTFNVYPLHALCLLGRADVPEVAASLRWLVEHQEVWNDANQGCPWTPEVFWSALWAGREVVPEVTGAVNDGLRRVTEGMNGAGCNSYNDPWGFTDATGEIESDEAAALVAKQIPMILRGQRPDGGWGGKSLTVFRALRTHGFLEPLRELPSLGPDWRIVREIPIPDGRWFSLTWDGENLWSCDHASGCAVALSPKDGHEVRRVAIANCGAVAWWNGALACVGGKPKELKKVDPETGEVLQTISLASLEEVIGPEVVGGKVLVGDGFNCCVAIFDPASPEKPRMQTLAGPGPACMAADGEAVWHADYWAPAIIKSDLNGKLLDWGERPFNVRGLAFDEEHLWALDSKNKRICMIEKNAPGAERDAKTARGKELLKEQKYGFRVDPMKFIDEGEGLQAVLVRNQVFGRPKEGDEEVIQAEIDKLLAWLKENGHEAEGAAGKLCALLGMGVAPERTGIREAVDAICQGDLEKHGRIRNVQLALAAGWQDGNQPARSVQRMADNPGDGPKDWDPWIYEGRLTTLWAGRDTVDVVATVDHLMQLMWQNTNAAGCWNKMDPWNMLAGAVAVDHPLSRRMVGRYIPMMLRAQGPDGSWDSRSLVVLRALTRYGLLEPLRRLPPLPRDWRIARSIPAPEGDLWTMTWDGDRLWVLDRKAKEAIALSARDGNVVKRLKAPLQGPGEIGGVGWYKGKLAITAGGTEHHGGQSVLLLVDPENGELVSLQPIDAQWGPGGSTQIGDDLWIAHGCWICVVNPETGEAHKRQHPYYGSWPIDVASAVDTIWHTDEWAPFLFRSDLKDNLIEFLDQPFFERISEELPTRGIAFDGKNLWALDAKNKRICVIEKTPTAPRVYRGAPGLRDDLYGLMNGLDKAQELEWGRVFLRDAEGQAEELAKLCSKYKCTQVVDRDGTILWLNEDERIEAAFSYVPDPGDIEALSDVYRRVERTDSPLTFVVFPQPGRKDTFDAHILSRRSGLEHSWELGIKAKAEAVPLAKGVRTDLYEMFRTPADAPTSPISKPERAYWSWRLSHSDEQVAAKLGRDAKHYGCTQAVDGGYILWKGADGKPEVMFRIVRDQADPKVFRRLYDKMIAEGIPLAYCFVNAYRIGKQDQLGDWDVWSMSRQKAQVHCWRFWAHDARPEPVEEKPDKDIF